MKITVEIDELSGNYNKASGLKVVVGPTHKDRSTVVLSTDTISITCSTDDLMAALAALRKQR